MRRSNVFLIDHLLPRSGCSYWNNFVLIYLLLSENNVYPVLVVKFFVWFSRQKISRNFFFFLNKINLPPFVKYYRNFALFAQVLLERYFQIVQTFAAFVMKLNF